MYKFFIILKDMFIILRKKKKDYYLYTQYIRLQKINWNNRQLWFQLKNKASIDLN